MIPYDRSNCGARPIFALSMLVLLLCGLTACVGMAREAEPPDESAQAVVQIRLDERRIDLPPGVSLIVEGGGMINNGFPALSADGGQIAVFYFAGHPLKGGYPTLDVYSTASLALQERFEFGTGTSPSDGPVPNTPEVRAAIENRLVAINSRLAQGGFQSMPTLFKLPWLEPIEPIENHGKRIKYDASANPSVLTITGVDTGEIEMSMEMPRIVPPMSPLIDRENHCGAQGFPIQGWHDRVQDIVVIRIILTSARDGCEQPEKWLLKRL